MGKKGYGSAPSYTPVRVSKRSKGDGSKRQSGDGVATSAESKRIAATTAAGVAGSFFYGPPGGYFLANKTYMGMKYGAIGDAANSRVNEKQFDVMERRGANPYDYGLGTKKRGLFEDVLARFDDEDSEDMGGFGDLGGSSPGDVGPL